MFNIIAHGVELAALAYLIFLGHGIPTAVLNEISSIFAPKTATTVVVTPTVHTATTTVSDAAPAA